MITEEQINRYAEAFSQKADPLNQTLEKQADIRMGFIAGMKKSIHQLEPKWIPCNHKHVLTKGQYALYLFNPLTNIGDVRMINVTKDLEKITYFFVTHYCPFHLPEPPKTV